MRKILIAIAYLFGILIFGTTGYMLIEHSSLLDSLFMTVITVTTVGYGETIPLSTTGRYFTIFLIMVGAGLVLYLFSKTTEAMVEGGLQAYMGRKTMNKKVAGLKDHFIVCGFGRIGKVICQILHENKRPFVVIENEPNEVKLIEEMDYLVIEGDAANDETLEKASIQKAKGLIAVVSSDANNVYIILSAKGLNPKLFVLARSSGDDGSEIKMLRAGANKVISPYYIGACRMAQLIVRPTVIDFIDLAVNEGELGLRIEELSVSEKAKFVNQSLLDSGIRKEHDLIVVAIKREHGEMLFNPNPSTLILNGDILVVLGEHVHINNLTKQL
jgi:voltage-gated potassium channel